MTETHVPWRKSTYSGSEANCVEAGHTDGRVLVRDTKNREGTILGVQAAAWRMFVGEVQDLSH